MYRELLGQKLNLRKVVKSDAESIYKNAKDRDICLAVPLPMPYTLKSAQDYIKICQKKWKNKEETQFGIEEKETGKIVGMIGLMNLDFKSKKAEVGYWLGKNYWGKGITEESLNLILRFAFSILRLNRVYAKVKSRNIPSSKVLLKCNFRLEGRLRKDGKFKGKWDDLLIYGILKEEYSDFT